MKKILIFFFVLFFCSGIYSQNFKQVKIYIHNKTGIQNLRASGLEFDHFAYTKDGAVELFLSDSDFDKLKNSGFRYDVLINDWYTHYAAREQMSKTQMQLQKQESKIKYNVTGMGFGSMGGYYTFNEVLAQLDTMRAMFPGLITAKESIGKSLEGRSIYMVKISSSINSDENKPQLLFTALHHAREPEGVMQMIYYMYYLLENYNTDPIVKYLVDNRAVYFIPVVNPDGYEYNRRAHPGGGGMWRMNRRNNSDGSAGVDLNRNYGPYKYWDAPNGGSDVNPGTDTYRGTAPFSEPETQVIRDFLSSHKIKCALNYHTYGNDLISPYGALDTETPDSLIFREFSSDMTIYNHFTTGTDLQTVGYSTRGNSDDYFYDGDTVANSGKIIAMTPEVGNASDGFWPDQNRIFPLAEDCLYQNLYFTWVAGGYASLNNVNYNRQIFNAGDDVSFSVSLKNKGLQKCENITAVLSSLNPLIKINKSTLHVDEIDPREIIIPADKMSFSIEPQTPVGSKLKMVVTVSSGNTVMSNDTLTIYTGTPRYLFADTTSNPTDYWSVASSPSTSPKWEATSAEYHSAPTSFTDSKWGNYANRSTVTMTLKDNLDLAGYDSPILTFWTKYDIEAGWDFAQVQASSDNGASWAPLHGLNTTPGSGSFQPAGEPLYSGLQNSWIKEEMELSAYANKKIKIRFLLKSDEYVTRDGWYVDDIGVKYFSELPVELTSFTGSEKEGVLMLNWITATETNNYGFEIQKAFTDYNSKQKKWTTIGFVNGIGTTTEEHNYTFTDKNPSAGKNVYRLKQIDYNGTFEILGPLELNYAGVSKFELVGNYPNPFNPSTTIEYTIPEKSKVVVSIIDITGKVIGTIVNQEQQAGRYKVNFDASNFASGIYFYRITAGNFSSAKKMILLR